MHALFPSVVWLFDFYGSGSLKNQRTIGFKQGNFWVFRNQPLVAFDGLFFKVFNLLCFGGP
jgi:hypothetical protein